MQWACQASVVQCRELEPHAYLPFCAFFVAYRYFHRHARHVYVSWLLSAFLPPIFSYSSSRCVAVLSSVLCHRVWLVQHTERCRRVLLLQHPLLEFAFPGMFSISIALAFSSPSFSGVFLCLSFALVCFKNCQ